MKIAIIGFGTVGQGLVEILRDKAASLRDEQGFICEVVAVATGSRGTLYHPDGLDLTMLLEAIGQGHLMYYPNVADLTRGWSPVEIAKNANADVLVECSPTNLETGQPALDTAFAALDSGKHVVMANKGPATVAYHELMARAAERNRMLGFEGTVMSGTPSIHLGTQALAGCTIREVRGIINGTTNYILTQMEGGMSYADALAEAQRLGYAETDPTGDVEGWDAAGKVIILSHLLFGATFTLEDMSVTGISQITQDDVQAARAAGERWKLIARVTPTGGSVGPVRLPVTDPLAGVSGAKNALTYDTDLLGEVTLIGPGAGRLQTGFALLADLLHIQRSLVKGR